MADFNLFFPVLMREEGGDKFTDAPGDHGGATKFGITFKTWLANGYDKNHDGAITVADLKLITIQDAQAIAKKVYWDKVGGDQIPSQPIAVFLFDWAYNSGAGTAVMHLQQILGVPADGIMGQHTITALLGSNQHQLFNALKESRLAFVKHIVTADASQMKWYDGWCNRINSFSYTA